MSDEKKLVAVIVELFSLKENAPSKINGSTSPSNEESTKRTNIKTSKTRQKKKHTNFRKTEYTRSKTMVKTLFHLILKDDPGHHDKEQKIEENEIEWEGRPPRNKLDSIIELYKF